MSKAKMLIAVDGFEASAKSRVGVGRLEVELLKELNRIDAKNTYRLYVPHKPRPDLPHQTNHWQYRIASFNRLWSQLALPLYLAIDTPKPNVFFSPVHYAPRFIAAPLVLGIMDLSFIYFPDMFRKKDLFKLHNWTKYSVYKARRILAISQSTKNDILETYGIHSERVDVVYPGIPQFGTSEISNMKKESVMKKYGISKNYILYVGTLQPRKNIVRLIEAFNLVIRKLPAVNRDLQLVIAGIKGWLYETIFAKVKELGQEQRVIFTGFVPDEELPALYGGARCFCLVSLYEGFGFPVLEAMQAGTVVICSNVSSLPELAGDAGILVNPEDTTEIARAILNVLAMKESELKKRIEKGKKQASKFTWEKTARETLKILEEVGNR